MSISKAQIPKYFEKLSSIQNRTYRGYAPDVIALLEGRKVQIPGLNTRMVHNVAAGGVRNFIILNAIAEVVQLKEDEMESASDDGEDFNLKSA
jgi:hypothetical protein